MKLFTFDQTTFNNGEGEYGDCCRAVVYTLAQRDLELPHPIAGENQWNMEFFEVLLQRGFVLNYHHVRSEKDFWPRFVGQSGISPRGINHLVVFDRVTRRIVHDPHPSRSGIGEPNGWFVLLRR